MNHIGTQIHRVSHRVNIWPGFFCYLIFEVPRQIRQHRILEPHRHIDTQGFTQVYIWPGFFCPNRIDVINFKNMYRMKFYQNTCKLIQLISMHFLCAYDSMWFKNNIHYKSISDNSNIYTFGFTGLYFFNFLFEMTSSTGIR